MSLQHKIVLDWHLFVGMKSIQKSANQVVKLQTNPTNQAPFLLKKLLLTILVLF